jgi:5-methylcytosine-specific restriction endonuclease McrA
MVKNDQKNITLMYFEEGDIHLTIDPNVGSIMNYKDVKNMCEKFELPFTNQSFQTLIQELKQRMLEKKNTRVLFTKTERDEIIKDGNSICCACNKTFKENQLQIDHILALANGGTNNKDNLQLLCKECHFEKTKHEKENGYVKLSATHSSFNQFVQNEVISKCQKYAFIETLNHIETGEQDRLYHFDINKCRTNILRHGDYRFCQFTIMDEPKKYIKHPMLVRKTGLYWVETEQYFPMRGSNWLYLPMVNYALEQGLIQESDIKYKLDASLKIH